MDDELNGDVRTTSTGSSRSGWERSGITMFSSSCCGTGAAVAAACGTPGPGATVCGKCPGAADLCGAEDDPERVLAGVGAGIS